MPKRKPEAKGLRDIRKLPKDPWIADEHGNTHRGPILDREAPLGRYTMDLVVSDMFKNGSISSEPTEIAAVKHGRRVLDVAGASAIRHARADLSTSSRYEHVKNLYKHLRAIRDLGRRASIANPDELAGFIAREDDAIGVQPDERDEESHAIASGGLEELLSEVGALADKIDQQLRHYPVKQRQPSGAEPLTYYYMAFCAGFWHSFTGRSLDRNDQTDFRRFLVGGWQDLRFPDPVERNGAIKPLEDHIRERLAKSDIFDHFGGQ